MQFGDTETLTAHPCAQTRQSSETLPPLGVAGVSEKEVVRDEAFSASVIVCCTRSTYFTGLFTDYIGWDYASGTSEVTKLHASISDM